MIKTKLKGGSLSGTYMMGDFVRKECSIVENREYGYQRWYSQLKRLQRYNQLFPEMFPRIFRYGIEGDMAYYDMSVAKGVNGYEFLKAEHRPEKVKEFFDVFLVAMEKLHALSFKSSSNPIILYIREEVKNKLQESGVSMASIDFDLDGFSNELYIHYSETEECLTHGNLTLENVMYHQDTGVVVFIDPYEENIIDSHLCDYSQVLQSCHSHYEHKMEGNKPEVPTGIEQFYLLFHEHVYSKLDIKQQRVVDLFEISQYIRMLPFKVMGGDIQMAKYFHKFAQELFTQYKKKWNGK